MEKILWHTLDFKEVAKILRTNLQTGLPGSEAEKRQRAFGSNKLPAKKPISSFWLFLSQFKSPLVYILLIGAIATFFFREFTDCLVILGAVFVNTIVGFLQEKKAQNTLRALKKVVKHKAEVLRDSKLKIVDSEELVPGDIIILNPGERVPADGRLVEAHRLKINEMALTGEWMPANKHTDILPEETPLADRDNMVYMGTIVESGFGRAVVVNIGENTEIGKVAKLIKETKEEKTPYQKKLAHFSKIIGIVVVIISLFIFIEGMVTLKEISLFERFKEMFTTAIAVAVAAIPEGLPVAMTIILALGMQKILQRKGLVRKLVAAETLGSTSVIATDKTGTLTEGKMAVAKVIGKKEAILKCALLTSEAFIENPQEVKEKWIIRGKPTERALLKASIELYGYQFLKDWEKKRVDQILFDSIKKFKAALYQEKERFLLFVCGAPEKLLELSSLSQEKKAQWEKELTKLTKKGLRVVACAKREIKEKKPIDDLIENLEFLGLITLSDPVRKDAKEAIKICKQAGLRVIIVTGDHKLTTKAIAEELGLKAKEEEILEGVELDKLTQEELMKMLPKIKIFARVEPKHKMRIIEAWQQKGEVIAMTGDGINDAPALKKADIGVALGSGTEVAKETSDLILLNDSFSIIVAAIEEGRRIIDNIRKVITYLLSDSFTEVILIGASIITQTPLPVTALQILWVNLIEDTFPSIALAFEPKERDIMKRKPIAHKVSLLTREMKAIIFIIGIITDFILLGVFFWLLKQNYNIAYVRTIIFASLALNSLLYIFSCKNLRKNLWQERIFSNKLLIGAVLIGLGMLILAIYLPTLRYALKTQPLGVHGWLIVFGASIVDILLIEATKFYFITRHQTET